MASDLANRCRPKHIEEVWGNETAKSALRSALANEKRPQVYLFTGPAGCGKTTLARAFANELGASSSDITELNMSDNTGIDTIRGLIEESQYKLSDVAVYILDEAHQITSAGQSCALKMLEEPHEGTYYMLCTTNPEKLSKAIQSRCITITVKPMDEDELTKSLRKVARAEGIDTTIDVLEAISEKAEGAPRRALKLLDKVNGLDEDKALSVIKSEVSGDVEDPNIKEICKTLLDAGSWKTIANNLKLIKGADVESVRRQILGYMSAILLNGSHPVAATIMSYFLDSFFNSGFAGLTYACFAALSDVKQ